VGSVNVAIQQPVIPRDYESDWAIPQRAIRVNVTSTSSYGESVDVFSNVLAALLQHSQSAIFETFDLYTPLRNWPVISDRQIIDVDKHGDASRPIRRAGDLAKVVLTSKGAYTATECPKRQLTSLLRNVHAAELIFSFWNVPTTTPIMFRDIVNDDRFERIYLESLTEMNGVAFLSRDHVELELYTVNPTLLPIIKRAASGVVPDG
jgi:hypothetical protein